MVPDVQALIYLDPPRYPQCPRAPDRPDKARRTDPDRGEHPHQHDLPTLWTHDHRAARDTRTTPVTASPDSEPCGLPPHPAQALPLPVVRWSSDHHPAPRLG